LGITENVGPLFNFFAKVLVVEGGVDGSVPDHHLRTGAGVSRVSITDQITPGLSSHRDLPLSASRVPSIRAGEACKRNTRVNRGSLEQVRVASCHDVGHHRSGGGTGDVDVGGVDTVVADRVGDHGGNTLRVSSTVVGEGSVGVHVEAATASGCVGVYDDEAISIGEGSILGTREVGLSGTRTVVDGDDEWSGASQSRRLVDEHADIVGVRANVTRYLRELVLGSIRALQGSSRK